MKNLFCFMLLCSLLVLPVVTGYSATTSGPIPVTASIQAGTPDMTVTIHKLPKGDYKLINWDETLTSLTFDKFTVTQRTGHNPQWSPIDTYAVFVYADGLGKQYQVKSSGAGTFASGSNTLPVGSFACIPVYSADDEWKYPDGTTFKQGANPGTLGTKGMALTSNKVVYTSENPGSARIIQVHYSFPPYEIDGSTPYSGYEPIPANQANGNYTGVTVTLDITAL
ncbi:MAG: hypothetical protein M0R66_04595 [Candidatus Omnitrophica bacterium]|nr:hypothetical protein [Candidatus Omnitrophota bacterium]MDD5166685.1 hypothetical protein [Candidatus Omnitrophota bacterium]